MVKPRIKREFEMWKVSRDGIYSYHCTLGEAFQIARNIWNVSRPSHSKHALVFGNNRMAH